MPVGTNFAVLGYGYSRGNILLDPAVPIEDLDAKLHVGVAAYVRSVSLFGKAGKLNVVVPVSDGDWTGKLEGADTSTARSGFGDPRIQLSWTFAGAPALRGEEFRDYEQRTIYGASLQIIFPVGQYYPDRLINLGSNRWVFRPQIGLSRKSGDWVFEAYGGLWLFTKNPDFFGGSELEQKVFYTAKVHAIRPTRKGRWISLDAGFGIGGRTKIDGVEKDTRMTTFRIGATLAQPVTAGHTIKLTAATAFRHERGPQFDAIGLSWQYRWGGGL